MDRDRMTFISLTLTDSTLCHANLIRAPSVLMNRKILAPGSHHGRGSGAQCHKIKVSFLMFLDMLLAVMISRLVAYFYWRLFMCKIYFIDSHDMETISQKSQIFLRELTLKVAEEFDHYRR